MFHRMMNYGEAEARPNVLLTRDLIKKSLPKFKRHDDLVIFQEIAWEAYKRSLPMDVAKCENSPFSVDEDELASLVCQTLARPVCRRLAIERAVRSDGYRSPSIELLLGESGVVTHKDNGISYQFDVTKCMFSFGNVREKLRMAELDCSNEVVVDLFAGIGYFTLPLLVHSRARHLYACEWNPHAVEALKRNLIINKIDSSRCTVIDGDNRLCRPTNVAQRVILGILPSSIEWMTTALECVDKSTGAVLHCHDLVETKPPAARHIGQDAKQSSTESQRSDVSASTASHEKPRSSLDDQSLLNQSISSSTSSHSTIEKLSAPASDELRLLQSGESSDKDTSWPVMLEKSSTCSTANISCNSSSPQLDTNAAAICNSHERVSLTSSLQDEAILEPPQLADSEMSAYEARGLALIGRISAQLEAHDLSARLLRVQPVKSYAPHINHVVFDIRVEPRQPAAFNNGLSLKQTEV